VLLFIVQETSTNNIIVELKRDVWGRVVLFCFGYGILKGVKLPLIIPLYISEKIPYI